MWLEVRHQVLRKRGSPKEAQWQKLFWGQSSGGTKAQSVLTGDQLDERVWEFCISPISLLTVISWKGEIKGLKRGTVIFFCWPSQPTENVRKERKWTQMTKSSEGMVATKWGFGVSIFSLFRYWNTPGTYVWGTNLEGRVEVPEDKVQMEGLCLGHN